VQTAIVGPPPPRYSSQSRLPAPLPSPPRPAPPHPLYADKLFFSPVPARRSRGRHRRFIGVSRSDDADQRTGGRRSARPYPRLCLRVMKISFAPGIVRVCTADVHSTSVREMFLPGIEKDRISNGGSCVSATRISEALITAPLRRFGQLHECAGSLKEEGEGISGGQCRATLDQAPGLAAAAAIENRWNEFMSLSKRHGDLVVCESHPNSSFKGH